MSVTSERVHDYTVAREAQVLRLEAATGTRGGPSDPDVAAAKFYAATGAADLGGEVPLTYKLWLQQTTPPQPSPDDHAAVKAAELARAWAVHDAADAAADALKVAAERRGAVFAELVAGGWSCADLGRALGVSRAAIHQAVKAHHGRTPGFIEGDW